MKPKPRIFEVFPEAEAMISDVVLGHLDHFSVAMLRNELITIIIPGLKQKAEDESVPVDSEEYLLLSHLSAQPPSYSTVLRWLHYLGYTHDKLKKSYYVDGHEHQEQKLHRSKFIKKYFEVEIQTHRWVQMSIVEFEEAQSSLSDDGNDKIMVGMSVFVVQLEVGHSSSSAKMNRYLTSSHTVVVSGWAHWGNVQLCPKAQGWG